jgi:addiction module RelB/DinJ family antitoxin
MTETFRCRVDRKLLAEATRVAQQMGTTPGEIVRMLFTQLVQRRELPFTASANSQAGDDLVNVARRNRIWRQLDDAVGW